MVGSVGTAVRHRTTQKRGRVIHGEAGWIGVTSTMVRYADGTRDEVPDGELEIVHEGAIVMCPCPTCKTQTPHKTVGVETNERGPHQRMKCVVCDTSTNVYGGEGMKDFQQNLDTPDGTE